MATYPVKYIHEAMRGAPVLSGQPGALIALLDAFLLTGFGAVAPTSVTVAAGVATAALPAGQTFEVDCIVLVSGATPAALNGEARVLTSASTSITFATAAPDGAASGAISIRVAPVGQWSKPFSAPNKAVYRSTDPAGPAWCYRVDDSDPTVARVRGYESMTDVDSGSGPFPTEAQISGGGYWLKSSVASAAPAGYFLAADSRTLYVALAAGLPSSTAYLTAPARGWGDMLALAPGGDVWSAAISVSHSQANFGKGCFDGPDNAASGCYCPRPATGSGTAQFGVSRSYVGTPTRGSGDDPLLGAFPSSVAGSLFLSRRFLTVSGSDSTPRSEVPGLFTVPQSEILTKLTNRTRLKNISGAPGKTFVGVVTGYSSSPASSPDGMTFYDITGPWR